MNGDPTAPADARGDLGGEIALLLLRDGVLSEAQLRHVGRIRAKLASPRPVVPLLVELGLLDPDALRATLQRHRLELRIGALLVELGHLRDEDLAVALDLQERSEEPGRKLGEILVEQGLLGAQQLVEVLSSQLGVPAVEAGPLEPDLGLVARAPLERFRRHRFLPLGAEGGRVVVAFADPLDKGDAAAAQELFGSPFSPRIASDAALLEAIGRLDLSLRIVSDGPTGERTAVETFDEIVEVALRESVSEIHLEPGPRRLQVRLRRDGVLTLHRELPATLAAPLLRRLEQDTGVRLEAGGAHREGSLRIERKGECVDFAVAFLATADGESAVLRPLAIRRPSLALEHLGLLSIVQRRLVEDGLSAPAGLFLFAGPRRSGRTATLHACARARAHVGTRLVLLEEEIDARVEGVTQAPLAPDGVRALPERLDAALHQEADVIAVDALRGSHELAAALATARSGACLLAVLDAEDAGAALLLAASAMLPASPSAGLLVGALAQRLVRRVCDACAEPFVPSASDLRRLGCTPLELSGVTFRRGRGCGRCRETGYVGRVGVFELLVLDEAGRDHLRGGEGPAAFRRGAALTGPATLLEDGLLKAARGQTSIEELLRVVPRSSKPRPVAEIAKLLGEDR